MALTKVTGHVVLPTTNIEFHNTKSTGIVTFAHTNNATSSTTGALQVTGGVGIVKDLHVGGNVTVGGTLTYDDVTNIDSLGIITARGGINVSGGNVTITNDLDVDGHTELDNLRVTGISTFGGTGIQNSVQIIHNSGYGLQVKRGSKFLDINGDWAASGSAALNAATSGIRFYYGASSDGIQFNTGSGTDKVRITGIGSVGIGTTNPLQPLDVRGDIIAYTSSTKSVRLVDDGNIEITNNNGGIIDFKTADNEDFDCRIRQMSNGLQFMTGGNGSTDEALRIDSNGRLLIGHDTNQGDFHGPQTTTNRNPVFQLHGANASSAAAALISWSTSSGAYYSPVLYLGRSGSGTKGTNGIIPSSQTFGSIVFSGDDGTDFVKGAMITAKSDGTPGTDDMPGRLEFHTTPIGAQAPAARLSITSDGKLGINYGSPTTIIHAIGNGTVGTSVTMTLQSHDTANATAGINLMARDTSNNNETCYIEANSGGTANVDLRFGTGTGEKVRITRDGQLELRKDQDGVTGRPTNRIVFRDLDGSVAAEQPIGEISWYSTDAGMVNVNSYIRGINEATNGSGALTFGVKAAGSSEFEALRIRSDGIIETGTAIGDSAYDGNQRLRVGRTGDCNISIRANGSTTSSTGLDFGDDDDDRAGRIQYMHNGDYMSFHTNGAGTGASNERIRITSDGALGIGNLQTAQSTSTTHTSKTKFYIDSTKFTKVARLAAGNITSAGWFTVAKIASSNGNYFKCYASIGGDFTQDMCIMELTGAFSASGALQNTYAEPVFKAHRVGAHSTDRITRARFVKDSSNVTYLQIYIASGHSSYWGKSVLEYTMGTYAQNIADSGSAAMFETQASGLTGIRTLEVDDNAICVNAGSHKFYSGGDATERLTINSSGQLIMTNAATTTFAEFSTTNNNTRALIRLDGKNSSGTAVSLRMGGFGDTNRGEIFTQSNHSLGFATNNAATQMTLDTGGKLLIGATSATLNAKLQVSGRYVDASASTLNLNGTGNDGPCLELFETGNTADRIAVMSFNHGSLKSAIGGGRGNTGNWGTDLRFYTHKEATSDQYQVYEKMRIRPDGITTFGSSGSPYSSNTVSVHPDDGMVCFGMDGRTSLMSSQNSCYIFSGSGPSGDMPAGTLVLQARSNVDRNILFATGSTPARKWAISGAGSVGGRLRAYSGSNTDGQMFDFYRPLTGTLPTANSGVETTIINTNSIGDAGAYVLILRSFEQSVTGGKLWSIRIVSSVFYLHSGSGNDGDTIEIPVTYSGHHNGGTSQGSNGHGPVTIKMHIDNGPAHTHGKITYTPNGFDYTGSNCDYYFYKLIDV